MEGNDGTRWTTNETIISISTSITRNPILHRSGSLQRARQNNGAKSASLIACLILSTLGLFQQMDKTRHLYIAMMLHRIENGESHKTDDFLPLNYSYSDSTIGKTTGSRTSQLNLNHTQCRNNPRRQPIWEWHRLQHNDTDSQTSNVQGNLRVLMAQYSSFGSYARLLGLTSTINKAYAKKWGHDYVVLQGVTLVLPELDGDCEPPPERSMYNKLELLRVALSKTNEYDQLVLLDADAMMYDFDYDVRTLLSSPSDMVAAHRVSQKNDRVYTWNINNGVSIWSLHHTNTKKVLKMWEEDTKRGVLMEKDHGDQHYLQHVLKHHGDGSLTKGVRSLPVEFFYERGTVAKHFIRRHSIRKGRWNTTGVRLENREFAIEATIQKICKQHPSDCQELEIRTYSE